MFVNNERPFGVEMNISLMDQEFEASVPDILSLLGHGSLDKTI